MAEILPVRRKTLYNQSINDHDIHHTYNFIKSERPAYFSLQGIRGSYSISRGFKFFLCMGFELQVNT